MGVWQGGVGCLRCVCIFEKGKGSGCTVGDACRGWLHVMCVSVVNWVCGIFVWCLGFLLGWGESGGVGVGFWTGEVWVLLRVGFGG